MKNLSPISNTIQHSILALLQSAFFFQLLIVIFQQKFGGPLDAGWRQAQYGLQLNILKRSRELGMISALPGFAGHVPATISRIYPNISLTRTRNWSRFNDTYSGLSLLDPTDPLFSKLGRKYYELLIKEFGTDHVFQMDTYNEMPPKTTNLTLLMKTNRAIYDTMIDADEHAVYLMQGWLFHESKETTHGGLILPFSRYGSF